MKLEYGKREFHAILICYVIKSTFPQCMLSITVITIHFH